MGKRVDWFMKAKSTGIRSGPREGNLPFVVTKTAAADVSGIGSDQLTDHQGTFGPEKGWLVIDGGEEPVLPAIAQRFVSLAGGPEASAFGQALWVLPQVSCSSR